MIPTQQLQQLKQTDSHCKLPIFWLGTWALSGFKYGKTLRNDAINLIQKSIDLGITAFDTAPFYGQGESDKLIYPFTRNHDIFISTKIGLRWQGNSVVHAASPEQLREDSLNILKTHSIDSIDLLLLHWPDPSVPVLESVNALHDLYKEGICKNWGVSNLTQTQIHVIEPLSPHVLQQRSSIFHPFLGKDMQNTLKVGYSPFEQGLLLSENKPSLVGKKDIRNRNPYFKSKEHQDWLNRFFSLCAEVSVPTGVISFLWPLYRDSLDVCLFGARTPNQLSLLTETLKFSNTLELSFSDRSNWDTLLSSRCGRSLWEHLQRVPTSLSFS